jgi:hypothetical protein
MGWSLPKHSATIFENAGKLLVISKSEKKEIESL